MLDQLLLIASGLLASTYGHGEQMCGDIGKPVPCRYGAITASGVIFDPKKPQAAIAAPTDYVITERTIYLRVRGGTCQPIQLVDKMNPRYIGNRGFDLTPAAVRLLTGKPASEFFLQPVYVCIKPGIRKYYHEMREWFK